MWDYDAVNENILVDLPIGGTHAQGARPLRPQRLRVHDRSRDRRGAAREAVRADELVDGRRPRRRAGPSVDPEKVTAAGQEGDGHLPEPRGRKEPAARRVLAARPGCSTCRRTTSAWTSRRATWRTSRARRTSAPTRRRRADRAATAASSWRGTRRPGKKVWGIKEPYPGLGRRARDRGRRRLLRHARRLVQGRRRAHRQGALEVQGRLRRRRQSRSPTPGPDGKQYVAVYAGHRRRHGPAHRRRRGVEPAVRRARARLDAAGLSRWTSWGGMLFVFGL